MGGLAKKRPRPGPDYLSRNKWLAFEILTVTTDLTIDDDEDDGLVDCRSSSVGGCLAYSFEKKRRIFSMTVFFEFVYVFTK